MNKPTTVELCISPVYRRLAVAEFFKVHNVEIAHVTLTAPTYGTLTHLKTDFAWLTHVQNLKSLALAVAEKLHGV